MRKMKKIVVALLTAGMIVSGVADTGITVNAKTKVTKKTTKKTSTKKQKVRLNKTKVTLSVGKMTILRLKGVKSQKTVKWSSTNKSVVYVSRRGIIRGRKAGKAKVVAKVGKRKYKCTVNVVKKGSSSSVNWTSAEAKYKKLAEYIADQGTEEDGTIVICQETESEGVKLVVQIAYDSDNEVIEFSESLTEEDGDGYEISMSMAQDELDLAALECLITEDGKAYGGIAEIDTEFYSEDEDTVGFDFSFGISDSEESTDDDSDEDEEELDDDTLDDLDVEASDYFNAALSDWYDYLSETGCDVTLKNLGFSSFEF